MALSNVFGTPIGLAAAIAVVPLVVLYIIQPDPRELSLPTTEFLVRDPDEGGSSPILERLRRNLLLLSQILVVLLLAVALASPYVSVTGSASTQSTVLVVDATASMATETGDGTRFDRAIAAAREAVGTPTTVLVVGATTRVAVGRAPPEEARGVLSGLAVTDAPGDLRGAIDRARSLASAEGRVVVFSDFAAEGWRPAVETARADGLDVSLEQFDDGGGANVGIVDRQFEDGRVIFAVENAGAEPADRTVSFAGDERSLSLQPGDVATVAFPVPAEPATAELSPRDGFPTDGVAHVSVPPRTSLDVLLLTNEPDRPLPTALDVIDTVDLTVEEPPATVDREYDVIIFGAVESDRILGSTVETARETLADGGGVAVQATPGLDGEAYSTLAPVATGGVTNTTGIGRVAGGDLTGDVEFPSPDRHVSAAAADASVRVQVADGSPLIATARREGGRVLYHGYLPNQSAFRRGYDYPIYWKRAVHWLADRPDLRELNRRTGETVSFDDPRDVATPEGNQTAGTVPLLRTGTYRTGERRLSASLLDDGESQVDAGTVEDSNAGTAGEATTDRREQDLTPVALLAVLLAVLGELAFLRYRGDI